MEDLQLEKIKGKIVLICGYTGSGKTTLLKKIKAELGDRAGYVMQNPDDGIVCNKVYEELAFGLDMDIQLRVAEIATYFGIADWLDRDVSMLSGGEKQILCVAAAMVNNPEYLLLDEPVAMLDPIMADRVVTIIRNLHRDFGTTIVIAEHINDNIFPDADEVKMVGEGDLMQLLPVYHRLTGEKNFSMARASIKKLPAKSFVRTGEKSCGEIVLQMKHITFGYDKNKIILDDMDFTLKKGEIAAVLGKNGSGKTTMAYILAGRLKAYSGKIQKSKNCRVGMLFQDVTCHFISDEGDVHPYDLSGGEKQLKALSQVLENEPDVLILDEPTKGLDVREKNRLRNQLRELSQKGKSVLIYTHDIEFAAGVSDRIDLLFGGRIVGTGSPSEFCRKNSFYTTVVKRLFDGVSDDVITYDDAVRYMGGI